MDEYPHHGPSVHGPVCGYHLAEPAAGLQLQICTPANGQASFRKTRQHFHARNLRGEGLYAVARVSAQALRRFVGWMVTICPAVSLGQHNHQLASHQGVAYRWIGLKKKHISPSREDASTRGLLSSKNVATYETMTSSAHVSDYVQCSKWWKR